MAVALSWGLVVLGAIFFVGWVWVKLIWKLVAKGNQTESFWLIIDMISIISIFLAVIYYLSVPFIVSPHVQSGYPWPVHWGYALLLVISSPAFLLKAALFTNDGRIDMLKELKELKAPTRWTWPTGATSTWTLAPCTSPSSPVRRCIRSRRRLWSGYAQAVVMLAVYIAGLILQPLGGAVAVCLQMDVDANGCAWKVLDGCLHVLLGYSPRTMPEMVKACNEIVRFLSENLPQTILQLGFARHISAKYGQQSYTVYVSVAMSFIVAFGAFVGAARSICGFLCKPAVPVEPWHMEELQP